MFIDSQELRDAGFEEQDSYYIKGAKDAVFVKNVCASVYFHKKIFIQLDSMGLGGFEGHITVWTKDRDEEEKTDEFEKTVQRAVDDFINITKKFN